jgi:hypothetical protein
LTTTDGADGEKVEQVLAVTQNGKELTITWNHLGDGQTHHFVVENVLRENKKSTLILHRDGSEIGSVDESEEVIKIPALSDFKDFDLNSQLKLYHLKNHNFFVYE